MKIVWFSLPGTLLAQTTRTLSGMWRIDCSEMIPHSQGGVRPRESGIKGVFEESGPTGLEPRPTINLFEQWEEGAHLPKLVNACNYSFPKPLAVPYTWLCAPRASSLSDAVNYVSQHEERCTWGQASQISLVAGTNYPNQPERNPGSNLSDPLTYWWGVTPCPPELNDVSLAESVVILMRYAAIKEMKPQY